MQQPFRRFFVFALIVGLAVALAACGGGSSTKVSTGAQTPVGPPSPSDSASTTTTTFVQTAAQKPCMARAGTLPTGAPDVPVKVGAAPTTLVIEDLKPGTGAVVTAASTVTVDYIGVACSTGKIFDASYSGGKPISFPLSGVIPGWSHGLVGMKAGGSRLLGIPSGLAYGPQGQGPDIGPDEALWFVVSLKSVA